MVSLHKALAHSSNAPEEHQSTQPHARRNLLQNDVARYFEENVWNEKNHGCNIVLSSRHMQVFREALNFCIPNVHSVKEGEHIKNPKNRKNVEVELPQKLLLRSSAGLEIPRAFKSIRDILFSSHCSSLRPDVFVRGVGWRRHDICFCRGKEMETKTIVEQKVRRHKELYCKGWFWIAACRSLINQLFNYPTGLICFPCFMGAAGTRIWGRKYRFWVLHIGCDSAADHQSTPWIKRNSCLYYAGCTFWQGLGICGADFDGPKNILPLIIMWETYMGPHSLG